MSREGWIFVAHEGEERHVLRTVGPMIFTVRGERSSWRAEWREPGNFRAVWPLRDASGKTRWWADLEEAKLHVEALLLQLGVPS